MSLHISYAILRLLTECWLHLSDISQVCCFINQSMPIDVW